MLRVRNQHGVPSLFIHEELNNPGSRKIHVIQGFQLRRVYLSIGVRVFARPHEDNQLIDECVLIQANAVEKQEVLVLVDLDITLQLANRNVLENVAGLYIRVNVNFKFVKQGLVNYIEKHTFVCLREVPLLDIDLVGWNFVFEARRHER